MFALAEKDAIEQKVVEQNIIEEPVDVDAQAGLFGIMTKPAGACSDTAFIIINAGLLHRVGPLRLYVDIARCIAEYGFPSIRLDQSGKGDSDARRGIPLAEATIADVTAAAEHLKRETGATRFVVGGLCSGADDALLIASEIAGLRGLFMFDGYSPKTMRYYLRFYGSRLFSARAWLTSTRSVLGSSAATGKGTGSLRNWSTRSEMIKRYRNLVDQGIEILAIYTRGARRFYNYESQLTATLSHEQAHTLLTEQYYPDASHLFHVSRHRQEAVQGLAEWARRSFGSEPDS